MNANIERKVWNPVWTAAQSYRQAAVIAVLLLSSMLCLLMIAVRMVVTHTDTYQFLAWNLGLAWLPLISAYLAYRLYTSSHIAVRLLAAGFMCFWLVFLPNAPYLITDLIHLAPRMEIGFWFDLTMFVAFAWTGLLCGLVSLYWMQQLVVKIAGQVVSWGFVLGVSGLSSYGVYLGRFLHWNSWDIIANPGGLFIDVWESLRHPIAHYQTFAFSGFFALFLVAAYLTLNVLTHIRER